MLVGFLRYCLEIKIAATWEIIQPLTFSANSQRVSYSSLPAPGCHGQPPTSVPFNNLNHLGNSRLDAVSASSGK